MSSTLNSKEKVCAKIEPCDIQSSKQQNLLGVLIDNKLTLISILITYAQRPSKNWLRYVEYHRS